MSVYCPMKQYPRAGRSKFRKRDQSIGLSAFLAILVVTLGLFYLGEGSTSASAIVRKQQPVEVAPVQREQLSSEPFRFDSSGRPQFSKVPDLDKDFFDDPSGMQVELTVDSKLQQSIESIIKKYKLSHASVVALSPKTGEVLSLVSKGHDSTDLPLALQTSFPAASLFKVVTAAAAIEESGMETDSTVYYRGGDYSLNRANYLPDQKRDTRQISLGSAMAKSCNPAFARLALNELSEGVLGKFASKFGLDKRIPFDFPTPPASFPRIKDDFSLARLGAGFGDVFISPLHAAMIAQTLANDGLTMRPYLVKGIKEEAGESIYRAEPISFGRSILPSTAKELTEMMIGTTEKGTAKRHFRGWSKKIKVAGKTGTLSGENPAGRYHWFIANAPVENPEISIAALVIDTGNAKINGSALGKLALEKYFESK